MKKLIISILFVSLIFVASFSQRLLPKDTTKFIDIVTGGTFNSFPDRLIGEAFEEYFESPRWRYYKDIEEDVVEFTGTFTDETGQPATVTMRFTVKEADETFILGFWAINGEPQDNSLQYAFLEKIFIPDEKERAISVVKDGYFYDFPGKIIGEYFDDFFDDTSWDFFVSGDGLNVVEFIGHHYPEGNFEEVVMQFIVDLNERTFDIAYVGVNDETKDDAYIDTMLGNILGSPVTLVKNSYYDIYYNTMTLGEAFDWFFTDPYWSYFVSTDDLTIVDFSGSFDLGGVPAQVYIQFEVYDDGYYDLYYWEIDGSYESINAFYLLLEMIYY